MNPISLDSMNIISIDFGKRRTGIFLRANGKEESLKICNKPKASMEEALVCIYDSFKTILELYHFDIGFIEGYAINMAHAFGVIPLAEVAGVIKLVFKQYGVSLVTIPVQTWKFLTVGQIDKHKQEDQYREAVRLKYDREFDTVDQIDAFLIYEAAKAIGQRTKRLSDSMRKLKNQMIEILNKGK